MVLFIEFLLRKFCSIRKISCEDYKAPNGHTVNASRKSFANYIQSAIYNDILKEKWIESIVENINHCTAFLVFITPHIIDSEFVNKEINYALSKKKPFYSVYLKDTKLPDKLHFQIAGIQSMKKYTMTDGEFYDKIKVVLSSVLVEKN